jgi:superfamily II DNA or RNA helicase
MLSRKGYIIEKNTIDDKILIDIKNDLVVTPIVMNNYGKSPDKFAVYLENDKRICVPKYYGLNKFGKPTKILDPKCDPISVNFNGNLREKQLEPYKYVMEGMNNHGGGVLSIPCGWGKTILSLKIISDLKVKTLVIVQKTFLMNQWRSAIKKFLPDAKIGIIQQDKIDVDDKDIVLGMLQSISMKTYNKKVFDGFGFVVVDEVHRICSKVFSKALPKVTTKYTLGLSATPNRDDGLSKIFHWYLGDMLYRKSQEANKNVVVKMYNYKSDDPLFKEVLIAFNKKPSISTMTTNITKINDRNQFIVNIIDTVLKLERERKILILSDRVNHLRQLKDMVDKLDICSTGFYIGGMKEHQLDASAEKDIIFGTFPMASEGLDIPALNTLIMVSSKSKITQSVGRILRKETYEICPLIIDIVDVLSCFKNQGYKRKRFYKDKKYVVETFKVENGKIDNLKETLIINDFENEISSDSDYGNNYNIEINADMFDDSD